MILKKLIYLDFYAMKPLAKTMIAFLIIPIILGFITNLGMSIVVTLTFVVFMLNMVFAIAEKSNFNKLYGILPIPPSLKITSRYLFSLIVVSISAIVSFIIFVLLSYLTTENINWIEGIGFLCISIFIAICFISIQYPFYFHFEYSKATIMSILPYILCFAIGSPLLSYLMKDPSFYKDIMDLVQYFQSHIVVLILLCFCSSMFLIIVSCAISKKVQKREF